MVKIDLITGFLGSGKTTFLKKYAGYMLDKGMNIGILENDYGAVNVDMMLLQDIAGDSCTLEMVSGGCDADCHRRRFKTKLIAMGMSGYDRVIVEPSGIFDIDEFFDVLHEEPLDRWYEIGSVIAIVDAKLDTELSEQSAYLLASQIANSGCVILSRTEQAQASDITSTIQTINSVMEQFKCNRRFKDELIIKSWDDINTTDLEAIEHSGYRIESYVKAYSDDNSNYSSLYFMNKNISVEGLEEKIKAMFKNAACGNIFRIKGFIPDSKGWLELNATKKEIKVKPIEKGQEIIIVIGEALNESEISTYFQ